MDLRLLVGAALIVIGCGESSAPRCDDGTLCPVGTTCGADDVCFIEADSCASFDVNAPCLLGGEVGYCTATECQAAVAVTGTVGRALSSAADSGLAEVEVGGADRPGILTATTNETGVFELSVVQQDGSLVLELAREGFVTMHTRPLAIAGEPYEINGNPEDAISMVTDEQLDAFVTAIGEVRSETTGAVAVRAVRRNGDPVPNLTAALVGASAPRALYFRGRQPAPAEIETDDSSPVILFPVVTPGTYTVALDNLLVECVAKGDDRPATVTFEAIADRFTNLGTYVCQQP